MTHPDRIILTTAFSVAQCDVVEELGIVSAESVYGVNVFKDIFAGLRDFFGGRSESLEKVLDEGRQVTLHELQERAARVGADAVIGIDLDYHELSGGGKSGMLMIVATGTAVRTRPNS